MSNELDKAYHDLCREACKAAGGKLIGSSLNAGCSMKMPYTDVRPELPHAAIKWFAELTALRKVAEALEAADIDPECGRDSAVTNALAEWRRIK